MKNLEKQLRFLIREALSKPAWSDMQNPAASELFSLISNRVGGAGMEALAADDVRIIQIVSEQFPELVDFSRRWLDRNPPMDGKLHRGIRIPQKSVGGVWLLGVKGRGQLSSWSDDIGIASGFGSDIGTDKGIVMSIPVELAKRHMIYGVKAYYSSIGKEHEVDELDEEEYVLKDFNVPPKYVG